MHRVILNTASNGYYCPRLLLLLLSLWWVLHAWTSLDTCHYAFLFICFELATLSTLVTPLAAVATLAVEVLVVAASFAMLMLRVFLTLTKSFLVVLAMPVSYTHLTLPTKA